MTTHTKDQLIARIEHLEWVLGRIEKGLENAEAEAMAYAEAQKYPDTKYVSAYGWLCGIARNEYNTAKVGVEFGRLDLK
jgi:hypothetical protein